MYADAKSVREARKIPAQPDLNTDILFFQLLPIEIQLRNTTCYLRTGRLQPQFKTCKRNLYRNSIPLEGPWSWHGHPPRTMHADILRTCRNQYNEANHVFVTQNIFLANAPREVSDSQSLGFVRGLGKIQNLKTLKLGDTT